MTQRQSVSAQRAVSTISLPSSTASARAARKSCTKTHVATPVAMNNAINIGFIAAKSASASPFTLQTNHAVASSISTTPSGTLRGNFLTAAVKPFRIGQPVDLRHAHPRAEQN